MRLSTEQLDSFEKQGFLVLENFVSAWQCENLRQCANELVRDFEVPGQTSIFTTNEQTLTQTLISSSPEIKSVFSSKKKPSTQKGCLSRKKNSLSTKSDMRCMT